MTSVAILIGNAHYATQSDLECCLQDLAAVESLIRAIGRYSNIRVVQDADADGMRDVIRSVSDEAGPVEEIFFYFSGHGAQVGEEFFYCGTSFDKARPNETGLSHSELHELFRSMEPNLLVKVVDACESGTLLVKSEARPLPLKKEGFKNVVQLASSMSDQSSFGGDPLSAFTRAFCEACLRRSEGPVYYGDLVNTLRDDFLNNDEQTPFFVYQGTNRDLLVDDAKKLTPFRDKYTSEWSSDEGADDDFDEEEQSRELDTPRPLSPKELLLLAEDRMVTPARASAFTVNLFDGVLARFGAGEFADFFEVESTEHSSFRESTTREFIIRVLSREARPDKFVTAEIKKAKRDPFGVSTHLNSALLGLHPEWAEHWDLELNCKLDRAQLRLALTPKYLALGKLVLVLTCAPSLEKCYIFELVTKHRRSDWDGFDDEGGEVVRRWYKMNWDSDLDYLIDKICTSLEESVREHIKSTMDRLSKE